MHRLFWKFFLSFWITLILFSAIVVWSASAYIDHLNQQQNVPGGVNRIAQDTFSAQASVNASGLAGLSDWARQTDHEDLVPILVLDAAGRDILGREVPARITERWNRHRQFMADSDQPDLPDPHRHPAVRLANGTLYWLIPDFQGATVGRFLSRPRVIAVPLLTATLLAALVCLFLARYLVAPIERLRRAAQDYAGGNFNQRVVPSLGRRRDEIVDLARALDDMAERLDSLISSQRHFLRDVSHELRSPLARVEAALGLVRQRTGDAIAPELDRIERETECLNELIGQILSLSRLETGMHVPRFEPVDLVPLLQMVVEDARLEAHAKGCTIDFSAPGTVSVEGDPALLHSAVENILRNAIRHTAPTTQVMVMLSHAGGENKCIISVEDRGSGVPETMLHTIFEPFVRVGEARDRASGGHGLGLAIAARAVQLHHGLINADNRSEGGLVVTIRLPIKPIVLPATS
jgi:two-component system sensor histidine kinase CpxA